MDDEQTRTQIQKLQELEEKWNSLKWLLLAFKKLMLWVAGVGAGFLVLWDILHQLLSEGPHK